MSRLLGRKIRECLTFYYTAKLLPKVTVPFCIVIIQPTDERSSCSTFSSAFDIISCFQFRHVVVSHHSFNLDFPNGWWCWTSFHVPICHSYILFDKDSNLSFDNWVLVSSCSLEGSLYILDISLCCVCDLHILSPSLWLIFSSS